MADKFYAVTQINYGTRTEDGSRDGKYEKKVFKPGDHVTGLPPEEMKSLWNAGALRREQDDNVETKDEVKTDGDNADNKPTPTKAASSSVKKPS